MLDAGSSRALCARVVIRVLTHLPVELETARLPLDRTQESDVVHASVAVECAKEQRHVNVVVHLSQYYACIEVARASLKDSR
jgi:hypothetical protein